MINQAMIFDAEVLYQDISRFVAGSTAGLLQLLVAASNRKTFNRIVSCPNYPVAVKTPGLSAAVNRFRDTITHPATHPPTLLARLYESVRSLKERKQLGQFFTAETVAKWALSIAPPFPTDSICDAGAGTGVFAHAIFKNKGFTGTYTGVENDPILALCAAITLESIGAPQSYKVWYANFLILQEDDFKAVDLKLPSLIIANPPFVRSHHLTGRTSIRTSLKSTLGVMLSSFSGSGSYFLSRAADLASSVRYSEDDNSHNERLLFFLPKEATGSAHAKRLREDLHRVHGWVSQEHQIPFAETGIGRHPSNALALFFVFERKDQPIKRRTRQDDSGVCVRDILKIKRGISTGCNEFFVLTDKDARQKKIPKRYLRAVLPTRIHMPDKSFSQKDWDLLMSAGNPCWLLALPDREFEDFEAPVQNYLKEGLRRGLHMTTTAKSMRKWFSIPIPSTPPDVFVTYFFRGAPRFIINGAGVLNLTNILGGRFLASIQGDVFQEKIIDSLNEQAIRWVQSHKAGREYKGGLRKIEPRELSMLPVNSIVSDLLKSKMSRVAGENLSLFD